MNLGTWGCVFWQSRQVALSAHLLRYHSIGFSFRAKSTMKVLSGRGDSTKEEEVTLDDQPCGDFDDL